VTAPARSVGGERGGGGGGNDHGPLFCPDLNVGFATVHVGVLRHRRRSSTRIHCNSPPLMPSPSPTSTHRAVPRWSFRSMRCDDRFLAPSTGLNSTGADHPLPAPTHLPPTRPRPNKLPPRVKRQHVAHIAGVTLVSDPRRRFLPRRPSRPQPDRHRQRASVSQHLLRPCPAATRSIHVRGPVHTRVSRPVIPDGRGSSVDQLSLRNPPPHPHHHTLFAPHAARTGSHDGDGSPARHRRQLQ
jgi:hypothetical protein